MEQNQEKSLKIGLGVIFVTILLIGIAVGFRFYHQPESDKLQEIALSAEETKAQVALELKDDQTQISHTFRITGDEILQAQAEKEEAALQKIYFVRVNNLQDVSLLLQTDVTPLSSQNETDAAFQDFLDWIKVRVYNSTDDTQLYEGSLRGLQQKPIEQELEATAAKKNDTRFRMYFSIDDAEKANAQDAAAEIKVTWSVPEEQAAALKGAQLPSLKIILYAFLFSLAIMLILYFAFKKFMKQEYLTDPAQQNLPAQEEEEEILS